MKPAAARFNVSAKTAAKWASLGCGTGLAGRDPALRRIAAERVTQPLVLRRLRCHVQRIAAALGLSPATVCRIPKRHRLNRLERLDPPRYEHKRPGELIHFDIQRWRASKSPAIASTATAPANLAAPARSLSTSPLVARLQLPPPSC